jgi:hypothetical protein
MQTVMLVFISFLQLKYSPFQMSNYSHS